MRGVNSANLENNRQKRQKSSFKCLVCFLLHKCTRRPTVHSNYGPASPLSGVLHCRWEREWGSVGVFWWLDSTGISSTLHSAFRLCIGSGLWSFCADLSHENRLCRSKTLENCATADAVDFMHKIPLKTDYFRCVGLHVNGSLEAKYRQVLAVFQFAFLFVLIKQSGEKWNIWNEKC